MIYVVRTTIFPEHYVWSSACKIEIFNFESVLILFLNSSAQIQFSPDVVKTNLALNVTVQPSMSVQLSNKPILCKTVSVYFNWDKRRLNICSRRQYSISFTHICFFLISFVTFSVFLDNSGCERIKFWCVHITRTKSSAWILVSARPELTKCTVADLSVQKKGCFRSDF